MERMTACGGKEEVALVHRERWSRLGKEQSEMEGTLDMMRFP